MSDADSGPGRREVAYRLFAAEFDDSEYAYSESDEERAPNYVVTPTGARVNRLFAVGVLTEVEDVNPEMVRGRLVDPTGAFVTYAGQYQPDALAVLERADPPAFFSLSGKARTYEPDDGDRIYSSVRPETVREVDAETRDRWVVTAAERTRSRIGVMAAAIESGLVGDQLRAALAEAGVDERLADGVALALEYYGTTPAYLRELGRVATEAVEVVAGERGEVSGPDLAPGEGAGDAGALATVDLAHRLGADRAVDPIAVVGLVRPGLSRQREEGWRVGTLEDRQGVGLVLPGVGDERPRRVDEPPPDHLRVDVLDLREDADGKEAVDPRAGRRHDVVGGALLVALAVGVLRVVELGGEEPVGDLPAAGGGTGAGSGTGIGLGVAHASTPARYAAARASGSSSLSANSVALRFAPYSSTDSEPRTRYSRPSRRSAIRSATTSRFISSRACSRASSRVPP